MSAWNSSFMVLEGLDGTEAVAVDVDFSTSVASIHRIVSRISPTVYMLLFEVIRNLSSTIFLPTW